MTLANQANKTEEALNAANVAAKFWHSQQDYPNYPNLAARRAHDLMEIKHMTKGITRPSFVDLGCGDGSLYREISNQIEIGYYYAFDYSQALLQKFKEQQPNQTNLKIEAIDLADCQSIPKADVTICLGVFPYIFDDKRITELIRLIPSPRIFVRAPCSVSEDSLLINDYSAALQSDYAALYRTQQQYIDCLEAAGVTITKSSRAYPDAIESPFGTKHFYFALEKSV